MINHVPSLDLRRLTEAWRLKAGRIQVKYGQQNPTAVSLVVSALETCAEEIEDLINRNPPSPTTSP